MVYITVAHLNEATTISTTLLEERLVACVNIVEGVQSLYWWAGTISCDSEILLFAKTTAYLVEPLIQRVKELHSYQIPCVTAFPILAGNNEYLQWIISTVRKPNLDELSHNG